MVAVSCFQERRGISGAVHVADFGFVEVGEFVFFHLGAEAEFVDEFEGVAEGVAGLEAVFDLAEDFALRVAAEAGGDLGLQRGAVPDWMGDKRSAIVAPSRLWPCRRDAVRTWIFQGNPKTFDIAGYLAASNGVITWTVARYADQILPGDIAYIWQSAGDGKEPAGVIAEGVILERPSVQADDPIAAPFWLVPNDGAATTRVRLRLNRIASKRGVLKRDWMKEDSVLKQLLIMRQAAGTTFPTTEPEARRLSQLWQKTGADWRRDEAVAALWLYEQLLGKPISTRISRMKSFFLVLLRRISHKYQIVTIESEARGWNTQRVRRMTGPCGLISTAA